MALQDAHAPARLPGRLEDDLPKERFVDEVGAGKRQDQSIRRDLLEDQAMDVLISAAGAHTSLLRLAKPRIEDDQVIVERMVRRKSKTSAVKNPSPGPRIRFRRQFSSASSTARTTDRRCPPPPRLQPKRPQ